MSQLTDFDTIEIADGYNGNFLCFFPEPIATDGDLVKLRCAEPGKEYLIKWCYRAEWLSAIAEAQS